MKTEETVQAYMDAWNEPDETKRRQLLEKAWAENGTYTDPMSQAQGIDELMQLISEFHEQMPGAKLSIASQVEQHHDQVRFAWHMEGPQPMDGIDVGRTTDDGRLESIVGFFGVTPPPA